jgi:hypothetical protein
LISAQYTQLQELDEMLEALSKADREKKGNRRTGERLCIYPKLTTDIAPVRVHATVDYRPLQSPASVVS